jgi:hypothetical protein
VVATVEGVIMCETADVVACDCCVVTAIGGVIAGCVTVGILASEC